ncbi:DNA adenine methylase [Parabacteroides sp. PF5-9]|uniref:DNA adenine methylase n=1 Tax=Parabacteroides sp. PF5-9 TaxID=1742404 RepID=UPI0024744831|nr:DNA adenine methylase [Parabacteroides sp. PF5-9]MDH6357253.1 adenine-specific DNA methylase [Parabacteroides sp. PF5-9]
MGTVKNLETVQASGKVYKSAPLPFQGQKRYFVAPFAEVLREYGKSHKVELIIDLFGGSGLLAHIAKSTLPYCRVIYNDYDDYHVRLLNIQKTNLLLSDIRGILTGCTPEARLAAEEKTKVLQRVEKEAKTGYVDYITLCGSLLFSGNYVTTFAELEKQALYNNVKKADYDVNPGDYLAGLEIYKTDYLELFDKFKDVPGVVLLVDPPYLSTGTKTYRSNKYWKLKDYLNVLRVLKDSKYVYFTSDKSSLIELCEWLEENMELKSPFSGAKLEIHTNNINWNAKYSDMMLYKLSA